MSDEDAIVVNDAEETAGTESTPNGTNDAAIELDEETSSEDQEESKEDQDTEAQGEESESEESDESEETDTTEKPTKADARKEQLNQEIRDLVAQRNQIRNEVQQVNQQAYQVPSAEQLLDQVNPETGEYYNRLEAQIESMKQSQALRDYNDHVSEQRLTMASEAQRALNDFPMFDDQSPEYNKEVAEGLEGIVRNAIVTDPRTGQVIGSNIPLYQLYQTVYASTQAAQAKGQVAAQKAQNKMMANTDSTVSSAAAKETKKDTFMSGFDSEL